jgi:hypothetical protein
VQFPDTQCGFKLFKADPLKKILPKLVINRFAFDMEILVALRENGYKIADAPVTMARRHKTTAANFKTIINMAFDTIRIWIRKRQGKYKIA